MGEILLKIVGAVLAIGAPLYLIWEHRTAMRRVERWEKRRGR